MAYRWSLEGPAFEFPTPYGTENRFLVWRGYALIAFALAVVAVVSFVGGDTAAPVVVLEKLPERASVVPHLVGAMLLTILGALDLLQAAARGTLLLAPGQPASLMPEVAREATGTSSGAAALERLLEVGAVQAPEPEGPYEGGLGMLGPELGAAPASLLGWLRVRFSHLALAAALALLLLMVVLVVRKPPAQALLALMPLALCAGVLALRLLQPDQAALPPWAVAVLVALALGGGAALGWFADALPRSASLPRLGLPVAAAVLLAGVLLFDGLALWAARAQLQAPWLAPVPAEATTVGFDADPEALLRDIDLELHRQWAEGVPNRRYAWQPPQLGRGADAGVFDFVVLEESQPLVPHHGRDLAPAQAQSAERLRGLLTLDALGLAFSLVGALLWLGMAWAHMKDATASWVPGATGLVCLLLGAYALRLGHLLWSRVEVQSTFTWLNFKGHYQRLPRGAEPDAAARQRGEPPVRVDALRLQARVALARSVFYAAAPHPLGSRVLLSLEAQRGGAAVWLQLLQEFARKAAIPAAVSAAAASRARPQPRAAEVEAPPATPRRAGRFCPHCGTAVAVGGRFCSHCGALLAQE